jgi:hypothetical protein
MSDNLSIGLSREQVEKLLKGETVGKRPYNPKYARDKAVVYDGTLRIYVRMLSNSEEIEEPESAFNW